MRDTGFSPKVKAILLERCRGECEGCGRSLDGIEFSRQHRKARSMGGTRAAWINLASNGLMLCGSATTPGGCHLACERRDPMAEADGLWIRRNDPRTPAEVPVRLFGKFGGAGRWVYLLDNGSYKDA